MEKIGKAKDQQEVKEQAKLRAAAEEKVSSFEKVLRLSRQQIQSQTTSQEELQTELAAAIEEISEMKERLETQTRHIGQAEEEAVETNTEIVSEKEVKDIENFNDVDDLPF